MFDTLSERLRKTLGSLTGRGRISEADVDAAMREVRLALLEADVNFKVVKDFVARVRERAIGADVLESLTRRPAGREDRQRRARRAPVGGRSDLPPERQPGRHRDGRPPGLGQDDVHGQARQARREARPPAAPRRRRPVPAGRRRSARDARQEPRRARLSSARRDAGRRDRPAGRRGRQAPGPRRRDHRHGRPAERRRGAHGRDRRGQRCGQAGRDAARRRRDDRPGGRRGRPGVRRPRSPSPASSSPRSTATPAVARRSRSAP